jgi:septum formation protein
MRETLILASASPYKRALLERLQLPFAWRDPDIDESPRADEGAAALALRLGQEKALAVALREPGALVIGGDQAVSGPQRLLAKPGTHQQAVAQLMACSGRVVEFYTSVVLARDASVLGRRCVRTAVHFRTLGRAEIDSYVARDQPLDCAGSFRWEGLGIALFQSLTSDDPSALEGLPLIALVDLLKDLSINPLIATS